jgi:hypothetical protein
MLKPCNALQLVFFEGNISSQGRGKKRFGSRWKGKRTTKLRIVHFLDV